jgi:hypothetical protein
VDEVCVSAPILKRSGHNDFRGTGGWFSWWKCWFCIILKKAHSAVIVSADKWKFTKLPEVLTKFCPDIYIALKWVYFIVPHWMLPKARNVQLLLCTSRNWIGNIKASPCFLRLTPF